MVIPCCSGKKCGYYKKLIPMSGYAKQENRIESTFSGKE
jgi:hypothetical protein